MYAILADLQELREERRLDQKHFDLICQGLEEEWTMKDMDNYKQSMTIQR